MIPRTNQNLNPKVTPMHGFVKFKTDSIFLAHALYQRCCVLVFLSMDWLTLSPAQNFALKHIINKSFKIGNFADKCIQLIELPTQLQCKHIPDNTKIDKDSICNSLYLWVNINQI